MEIDRSYDVISNDKNLEHLYTFKNFPVFMGCTSNDSSKDIFQDMSIHISPSTGVLQLNPILPLEVVYQTNHNSGVVGKAWDSHHKELASFIENHRPKGVLEIGGGHGILSSYYKFDIEWTIIEPNPASSLNPKTKVIKQFLSENTDLSSISFDTIVHSHLFEHIYDPISFVNLIFNKLPIGGKVIFSIPNMYEMLKRKYTNFLNFEHTYLLTEDYVNFLCQNQGFRLIDFKYYKEDHSIFYAWEKTTDLTKYELDKELYQRNKALFLDYINFWIHKVNQLNAEIEKTQSYYLFGAHVFSQYLIKFGLNTDKIVSILDNDLDKQGKRLYGTNLKVESPKILSNIKSPFVVLHAGVMSSEIKNDILSTINSSCKFI